ncbi:TPA: hypothetical protein IV312_002295 [Enterococcus faecium]|nr:hypothetical protein [Enterococcus faecium]
MRKIDAVILIEHINRELESAVLLKKELVQRGYTVEIVSAFWDFGTAIVKYSPKIIITPWGYDDWEMNLLRSFYGAGNDGNFKILNLHHEQMTYADAQAFMMPRGSAKKSYHIAWGEYYKEMLLKEEVLSKQICVTGSPRLDLFSEKYKSLSVTKKQLAEQYGLDEKQKWIMFLGNFSFAYFPQEKVQQQFERGNKAAYELAEESKYMLVELTKWIDKVCDRRRDIEIIYRPHPSEKVFQKHEELLRKYSNFHVIKDKTVRDWIVNIDVAYTWNSTSSVEVASANKPVYALRPRPVSESLTIEMLREIPAVESISQLLETIDQVVKGNIVNCDDLFKKKLEFYYSQGDKSATEKTADFIENILQENGYEFQSINKKYSFKRWCTFIKQKIKRGLLHTGMIKASKKYMLQKNDYFNSKDVLLIENKISKGFN